MPPGTTAGEGFVFLGRLAPEKGIATLLEAQKIAKLPLKIIGQEPNDWKHLAGEGVEFLGRVTREEALKIVAQSRALIFPSEWPEGCPGVIQEAMALARPVIASRVAGAQELVQENETGVLFDPAKPEQLAEKMKEFHAAPERCQEMGRKAREKYAADFSPEAGYKRLSEALQN